MVLASAKLAELGIQLPDVPAPVAAYVPFMVHGSTILTSGQIPIEDGKLKYTGKVGADQTLETAQSAARLCAINAIAVGAKAAGGVDHIQQVLKVVVYVAAACGFTDIHLVANGASEIIKEIFGERGSHARAAVGVAELPLNASVEVDVTFAMKVAGDGE